MRWVIVFLAIVAATVAAAIYTGFWTDVEPFVLKKGGPWGFDPAFAANTMSGFGLIVAQFAITFVFVVIFFDYDDRLRTRKDRAECCRQLCDLYVRPLDIYRHWEDRLPNIGQREQIWKEKDLTRLLGRYARQLGDDSELLSRLDGVFDDVVYRKQYESAAAAVQLARKLFKRLMPDAMFFWISKLFRHDAESAWRDQYALFEGALNDCIREWKLRAQQNQSSTSKTGTITSLSEFRSWLDGHNSIDSEVA